MMEIQGPGGGSLEVSDTGAWPRALPQGCTPQREEKSGLWAGMAGACAK